MRRISNLHLAVLFVLLVSSVASGQIVTATIYGVVQDPGGAVIPGAKVTARNIETAAVVNGESSAVGEFVLTSLQPGSYELTVQSDGFKALRRLGIQLGAGQDARLVLQLELGAVTETVEVTAETPLLNTANAEQQKFLESAELIDLPTARRDWTGLLNLGTGAQVTGGTVRLNGLAASSFRFTVDGTDASQDTEFPSFSMSGNFNFIKGISTEAIDQVIISKGIASAEIANTMSGNVNITTKSGTNSFHGSAFSLFNAEEVNAREQFLLNKPNLTFNQFGGSFGGAAIKNKLFFFGVYEGYRQRGFRSLSDDVPTPEFKQMVSSATKIYDNTLNLFPNPNQPYDPNAITGDWIGAGSEMADDDHAVIRGDWHVTDSTIFTARYTRGRPLRLIPRVVSANNRSWDGTIEQGNIHVTHIKPTMTFETRFGVNYNRVPRLDALYSLYENDASFNGIRGLGFDVDGEVNAREGWSWSIEEVIAKVKGRHSLKFGGLFMRTSGRRFNIETPQVQYASVQDLLDNIPSGRRVTMGIDPYLASFNTIGLFLQDDFRVTSNLVLNLGIRYDYFTVPKEKDGKLFNRAQPFGQGPYLPPDEIWKSDRNNFSPRIGFAYTVGSDGKTVIRGGAGLFHNPRPLFGGPVDLTRNALDQPFRVEFSRADAIANPDIFAWPIDNDKVTAFVKGGEALQSGTAINPDFPYPFSYQWNLTVQREIVRDLVIETGYVGTRGVNLMMVRFMNPPDRSTGIRPNPDFAEFRYRDAGESTVYHSWQTSVRKRFAAGASFSANYTYANGYSYTNDGDLLLPGSVQDIWNVRADKARPDQDVRHTFFSDFVYELPFAKLMDSPSSVAEKFFGGWQIAGLVRIQSGSPINIEQDTGSQSSRPDFVGSGDPRLDNYRDTLVYFDKSAFAEVPLGDVSGLPIRTGNVGRNALTDPNWWNLDLSLSKTVAFRETMRFKFDVQMLNAFNHTTFNSLETDITSGRFGRYRGTRGARVIQLNLRFDF